MPKYGALLFSKLKTTAKMMCTEGTLMLILNVFVFFFAISSQSTAVNFFHLGCFKDYPIRAIPEVLGVWRLESNATQRCAQAAKRAGYLVFGVQDGGECWSGPLAQETYKKYGASTSCVGGTGWAWAQDVYRIVNASLIANYDVKRCYEVEITFYYQIQGGLTSSTINNTRKTFSDLLSRMSSILSSLPECSNVTVTRKDIINSLPGVRSVFFRIQLIFTASTSVPDYEVSKRLTVCISTLPAYKQFLDSSAPKIKQGNISYSNYNLSSISNKTSCCCGDIPPPCCAVGSIRINSTKCGCLPGFHFVPGNLCERCPSDTYQDEQGQSSCKKCSGRKQTFGKTGMTSNSGCLDPPLIGNYDVKRCYILDIIFKYRIPGGLTVNTTRDVRQEFQSLFLTVYNLYLSLQQCKEVIVTIGNITSSPPGVSLVYFRVPLTFTASNNIADDLVAINVTTCVNAANVSLKGYIDRRAPNITQNRTTYQINQPSSSEKKSCCGGDIPPPCCAVGSIKVSNTSCGCLPGFHFVTGRSCVPCPSDTYQDEQGQKSCKTCPANTVTFGKTRMTNKANCTGCLPGFHFVTGRSCVSCPSDTYQDEHGQKYCKTCPVNTGTFGKTRMTNQADCTDTNPLQVNDQVVFLPENINNETIVVNVTVTSVLASLVRPFKFYVDNVTQPRLLSREVSRRKRRRVEVDSQCTHPELCPKTLVDLCFKAGAVKPENYFCIHRFTGRIRVTQDFVFKQGEVFDLQIRVTDSDPRGITVNTAKVKLISGDPCRNVLAIYDEAVKYCIKNSESVDGRKKCLSTQCTLTAHDWKEALNNASKVPEKDCSADPHNLTVLIRENPLCVPVTRTTFAVNVTEGESVSLNCTLSGDGSYTWERQDGTELENAKRKVRGGGRLLEIIDTAIADSGNYTCKTGRSSHTITLQVLVEVKVEMALKVENYNYTKELENKSSLQYKLIETNFTAEMDFVYKDTPGYIKTVVLKMTKGSVVVDFNIVIQIITTDPKNETTIKDQKASIVQTTIKEAEDGFVKRLKVSKVIPKTEPPEPNGVEIFDIKSDELSVRWKPSEDAETFDVRTYSVQYRAYGEKTYSEHNQTANTENADYSYRIKSLESETVYMIRVGAVNTYGSNFNEETGHETEPAPFAWWIIVLAVLGVLLILGILIGIIIYRRRRARDRREQTEARFRALENQTGSHKGEVAAYHGENVKGLTYSFKNTAYKPGEMNWEEFPHENIKLLDELGSGAFGIVFKGELQQENGNIIPCAVKTLKPSATKVERKDLYNELEIMANVGHHPNLVNLIGACTQDDLLLVIIELAENGCLLDFLKQSRQQDGNNSTSGLTEHMKTSIAVDVARGMAHLARCRCIHRDLAARNVLLGKDYVAKVSDYGMARDVYEQLMYKKETQGKLPVKWMAVESLETYTFTMESDVWAYGVLLWEIESGGLKPYAGLSTAELIENLKNGYRMEKPNGCSDEMYQTMRDCWNSSPSARPNFDELIVRLESTITT